MEVKIGLEIEDVRYFLETLSKHEKVTFVTTSTRSPYVEKKGESPKSSQLAKSLAENLKSRGVNVEVFDAAKLKIYDCLGCVSEINGNHCGSKDSKVKDEGKNPNGLLRCWASHDFEDDELWKISKSLYESQAIIFFGSQRWGTVNAVYQRLIERLDWIENMHATMGESNSVEKIQAGLVLIGQNWRVAESLEIQRKVLEFFGFQTPEQLFLGWQYTRDVLDESPKSYLQAPESFEISWGIDLDRWEKEKSPNESKFLTFRDFLNEIQGLR